MTNLLFDFLKMEDVEFKRKIKLSEYSSIKIGGDATVLFPSSEEKLIKTVDFLCSNEIKHKIIGRMTNVLPCDETYDGVIIMTRRLDGFCFKENTADISSGAAFSQMLIKAYNVGLGGAEELYGIPGSLGGMLRSNAGAFGKEISDLVTSVRVYDKRLKKACVLSKDELCFSYRSSVFANEDLVILSAKLCFLRSDKQTVKERLDRYLNKRKCSQPYGEPSLGSIFKRGKDLPVSYLIDRAGMKGRRIGGAEISEKHAGFIINSGGATAKDVKDLISVIKETLSARYGVIPEEEIEILV